MEEFVKTLLLTGKMAVITTAVLFFSIAHQPYTRVWKVFK